MFLNQPDRRVSALGGLIADIKNDFIKTVFHDEYIYMQDRGSRHYLLTMHRGCFGLRSARDIAIQNHTDRVCSNSQAEVSYRGPGSRLEKCFIRAVEAVEDRAAARTLVESRTRR